MGFYTTSVFLLVAAAVLVHNSASGEDMALTQNTLKNRKLPGLDVCGKSEVSDRKIINGTPAKLGEFPWMAAVGYNRTDREEPTKFLCGGSLITDQYVLTAAHCLHPSIIKVYKVVTVRLGELDLNDAVDDGAKHKDFDIGTIVYHEQYNNIKKINDVGLIKLKTKATFTDKIGPICLPPPEFHLNTYEGYSPIVAGWGRTVESAPPFDTRLMKVEVKIKNNAVCKENNTSVFALRNVVIDDKVLCASAPGKDSCTGDSGGPMMFYKNTPGTGNMYLLGMVSYGYGCARENFPAVYVRVTEYMAWIIEHMDI